MKQSKGQENAARQMNLEGECPAPGLFVEEVPVWYQIDGKVSPTWLSACEEERNQTRGLMERIADPSNLQEACRVVVRNGGSGGVDGMQVKDLKGWFQKNLSHLRNELLSSTYQPDAVRGVHIPKPKGGYRQLGIPTVRDRLVQQAISQVLNRIYDRTFSENSFWIPSWTRCSSGTEASSGVRSVRQIPGDRHRLGEVFRRGESSSATMVAG